MPTWAPSGITLILWTTRDYFMGRAKGEEVRMEAIGRGLGGRERRTVEEGRNNYTWREPWFNAWPFNPCSDFIRTVSDARCMLFSIIICIGIRIGSSLESDLHQWYTTEHKWRLVMAMLGIIHYHICRLVGFCVQDSVRGVASFKICPHKQKAHISPWAYSQVCYLNHILFSKKSCLKNCP